MKTKPRIVLNSPTVVGAMPDVHLGSVLQLGGIWKVDAKYGRQFSMESFDETLPATVFGSRRPMMHKPCGLRCFFIIHVCEGIFDDLRRIYFRTHPCFYGFFSQNHRHPVMDEGNAFSGLPREDGIYR